MRKQALALFVTSALFLMACDVSGLVGNLIPADVKKQVEDQAQQVAPTLAALATQAPSALNTPASQPAGKTQPTAATKGQPPARSEDTQSLISNSLERTIDLDKKTIPSYHLEASGTDPRWNASTKKVEQNSFTLKADVSGNDVHFTRTAKEGGKTTTTEAYLIGFSNNEGKQYTVEAGKVKESMMSGLTWVSLPLDYMPLIFAAMGPTAKGEEAVDGHTALKFDVDTAKAPTGAMGTLQGMGFNAGSSKGTVWIDKETGALLKAVIDYQQDLIDPPGSGKVVGRGSGHLEWLVTNIGKVTVKLPAQ